MRRLLTGLLALTLIVTATRAEESEIPIRVVNFGRFQPQGEHLAFIRAWLRANVQPKALAGVEVVIELRVRQPDGYCALATLAPHDRGTWRVQRRICFKNFEWGGGHPRGKSRNGPWQIRDEYQVLRIYDFSESRMVLSQFDRMSYRDTWSILKAVHERAVDMPEDADGFMPLILADVTAIDREDAIRYRITTTDHSTLEAIQYLTGWYYVGVLKDGRFVVEEAGAWIS